MADKRSSSILDVLQIFPSGFVSLPNPLQSVVFMRQNNVQSCTKEMDKAGVIVSDKHSTIIKANIATTTDNEIYYEDICIRMYILNDFSVENILNKMHFQLT